MNLRELESSFKKNIFNNEDDIKIHFHSDIVKPLLTELNPKMAGQYHSEDVLEAGGRTDATFQNISFEFKKEKYFDKASGIKEALYGRDDTDHGLQDYILSNAGINVKDNTDIIIKKILVGIGVGFDGNQFIFARYIPSTQKKDVDTSKVSIEINEPLNIEFTYEIKSFAKGLKRLAVLLKQTDKISLSKKRLCEVINPKSDYVRESILTIYKNLEDNIDSTKDTFNNRVKTLYDEWDRVFGVMYGDDEDATDFTEVSSKIREMYGISDGVEIDSKRYLFSMQTFFNIFLKLLVYSFLSQLVDPVFTTKQELSKDEINRLFDGTTAASCKLVNNFFESHFLEWFTFTANIEDEDSSFDVKLINDTRIQNGKFFNPDLQPFYRLDNVGTYTYSPYKVLWKEQTGSMSAVVVSTYQNSIPDADLDLFSEDKPVVVDSKVLMLDVYDEMEAYYVCGIINAPSVIEVVDGYAISTNRGVDVLKYIAIAKYDDANPVHKKIAEISKRIHDRMRETAGKADITSLEKELNKEIHKLFS